MSSLLIKKISHYSPASELPKKNKIAFVGILSQIKLLFGSLGVQLVWYILKQLFTSVSVKVMDIYLHYDELKTYLFNIARTYSKSTFFKARSMR